MNDLPKMARAIQLRRLEQFVGNILDKLPQDEYADNLPSNAADDNRRDQGFPFSFTSTKRWETLAGVILWTVSTG